MLLNDKQKRILEADARINGIERVSVWLYNNDEDSITTNGIYSLSKNEYQEGLTLHQKDFPLYFKALEAHTIIDANDALNDPRTCEFSEFYLKPLGITSMLDVPIRIGDDVIGVICHEHIGVKRVWTKEECMYATSVADLFALAIETADKAGIYNALLESEQRFAFALTALPVIFWTTDKDLRLTSSRGEGLRKVGFEANRSVGLTLYQYFDTTDPECLPIAGHLKALKGESLKFDYEFLGYVFESFVEPLRDNYGEIIGCIGMAINVTERKRSDEILQKREQQLTSIFDAVADSIFVLEVEKDGNYRFDSVNRAFTNITGIEAEEIIGKHIDAFIPEGNLQLTLDRYQTAIHENKIVYWEETGDYPNGTLTGIVSIAPLFDDKGNCIQLIGSVKDITERKKIENELKKSEERYQKFAELSYEGIAIHEMGVMLQVNPALAKMFGYSEAELTGMNALQLATPESAIIIRNNMISGLEEPYEVVGIRKNGEHFPIELQGKALEHNGKMVRVAAIRDITWRKKVENELRKSEERFRLLAETTNIIPWEIDAASLQCTYVGPQAQAVLGYPVTDWYEHDFWVNNIHPDDKEKALTYWLETYKKFENYEFEYRMIAKNGSIVWFHDVATVEFVNNEPVLLRGYLIDITTRKMAEESVQKINIELEKRVLERTAQLQLTNTELEKAKVTAEESKIAKELFLASMSHEIRTPLNAIIGFQQLLKETPLNEEQLEFVESIDFAGRNLLVIINDILDLSKIEAGKFEFDEIEFNVSDTVHSVMELVEYRAKEKNIKLFFSHDSRIQKVLYGDSTRLGQVLLNLIGNAVKFTEHGEVKVFTKLLKTTEEHFLCEFVVEDTGIGIPEDKLAFIFERFSQENTATSRKYGGTGLGLTISKHLVEMQGGTIKVESEKGKGSVFSFQLKLKRNPTNKTISDARKQSGEEFIDKNRKLNILLAEDVILNQRLVVKIMERWGHHLDIAENGKVAVDKVRENEYDLVLMDIQMPVMDGYHAAAMIRSLPDVKKQAIPIVALTAHASHAEAEKCINLGMNAYLAKPFNQQHLQQIINQLTNGK